MDILKLLMVKMKIKTVYWCLSFQVNDEKLLEKYRTSWTKIEDLKKIKLNVLPVYGGRYLKNKIRTENGVECGSFTIISIDSLVVYENKNYLQVTIVLFESDKWVLWILYYDRTDLSEEIDPAKNNNSKKCMVF